jgi:hypothetical protein
MTNENTTDRKLRVARIVVPAALLVFAVFAWIEATPKPILRMSGPLEQGGV